MWFKYLPHVKAIPCRCGEGFVGGDFEYVGITQASAAHACAVQDHHTFENADLQNAMRAKAGIQRYFQNCQLDLAKSLSSNRFPFSRTRTEYPFQLIAWPKHFPQNHFQ